MKIKKEDLPVKMEAPGTVMRSQEGFGGMTAAFNQFPKGTDLTPLLNGLTNNSCHCPHWGYLLEGAMLLIYDNGNEELVQAGDMFYAPSGHTVIAKEDVKLVDFSPTKELNEVMEHVGRKMAEMAG